MNGAKFELGIVRWYGTYNRKTKRNSNYGFIRRQGSDEDIFVHESNLKCEPNELYEDSIVVFQVRMNERKGKYEAVHVRKVDFTKDEDIRLCLHSPLKKIWKAALDSLLSNEEKVNEEFANLMEEKLASLESYERRWLLEKVCEEWFYISEGLRQFLHENRQLQIVLTLFHKSEDEKNKSNLLADMKDLVIRCRKNYQFIDEDTWSLIPEEILLADDVWEYVPWEKKIQLLLQQIDELKLKNQDYSNELLQLAPILRNEEYVSLIPLTIKKESLIFSALPAIEQVKTAWDELENYWQLMAREGKILSIYRTVQEKRDLSFVTSKNEDDMLVKLILFLVENKETMPHEQLVTRFDYELLTYMKELVADSTDRLLNLSPLLPHCIDRRARVQQCEAKRWRTPEGKWNEDTFGNELAFCPRLYGPCQIATKTNLDGARFHPLTETKWEHWSLLELFTALEIIPENYIPLRHNERYVLKLGGWVNRLNDIKRRLKCLDCKESLIPNIQYSKNMARYNITVAHCNHCVDSQVYFNHCWKCEKLIDSRESSIQFNDGYYICIHCGSGPMPTNDNVERFIQGSICPKCGSYEMKEDRNDREVKVCKACQHKIHLRGKIHYDFITPRLSNDELDFQQVGDAIDDFILEDPF